MIVKILNFKRVHEIDSAPEVQMLDEVINILKSANNFEKHTKLFSRGRLGSFTLL